MAIMCRAGEAQIRHMLCRRDGCRVRRFPGRAATLGRAVRDASPPDVCSTAAHKVLVGDICREPGGREPGGAEPGGAEPDDICREPRRRGAR